MSQRRQVYSHNACVVSVDVYIGYSLYREWALFSCSQSVVAVSFVQVSTISACFLMVIDVAVSVFAVLCARLLPCTYCSREDVLRGRLFPGQMYMIGAIL